MDSKKQITGNLLTLGQVFDDGKRQLKLPDYQRGYSWGTKQRQDLLKDIQELEEHKHHHFTGTVVASKSEEQHSEQIECFDLIDGQQRITSLIILLSCLIRRAKALGRDKLADLSLDEVTEKYIYSGKDTGNTIYRLELGDDRNQVFRQLLDYVETIDYKADNKADKNMVEATEEFTAYCNKISTEQKLDNLFIAITEKLGFLFYNPKQDAEIGIMFEVINNRGKPLSQLEKIKNYLIYFAGRHNKTDLKKSVNNKWGTLLEKLNQAGYTSNEQEDRFLRVCWIVSENSSKSDSHQVYENLKAKYPPENSENWKKLEAFVSFITECSETYAKLFNAKKSFNNNEEKYLQRIALHPSNASVLPLIVALYTREDISSETKGNLLDLIEKLNFRYYVTGIARRSDSGQSELFTLANDFYNNRIKEGDDLPDTLFSAELLTEKLTQFINREANDLSFVKHLTLSKGEAGNYEKWQGLKYFLASYEDFLREEQKQGSQLANILAPKKKDKNASNDFYHKEHIWAKKELSLGKDEENFNKRRLGNFIILMETINIKVGNERIEDKIKLYFTQENQPTTYMIRELKEDFNKACEIALKQYQRKVPGYWYKSYRAFFDIREERLINFALQRWQVSGLSEEIAKISINSGEIEDDKNKGNGTEFFKPLYRQETLTSTI